MSVEATRETLHDNFHAQTLLIGAGGIVGLLIVALLVAARLIDLNACKPEIAAEVKKATGRELVIDGPISLSILPTPTVTLSGVKFFNVPGSKNPNMVEVKSVTVKPSLLALLTGNVEVERGDAWSSPRSFSRSTPRASRTGSSRPRSPRPSPPRAKPELAQARCRSAASPSTTAR